METKIFGILVALFLLIGAIQFPIITVLLAIWSGGIVIYLYLNSHYLRLDRVEKRKKQTK